MDKINVPVPAVVVKPVHVVGVATPVVPVHPEYAGPVVGKFIMFVGVVGEYTHCVAMVAEAEPTHTPLVLAMLGVPVNRTT